MCGQFVVDDVEICPAHPARLDADKHFVSPGLRDRPVDFPELPGIGTGGPCVHVTMVERFAKEHQGRRSHAVVTTCGLSEPGGLGLVLRFLWNRLMVEGAQRMGLFQPYQCVIPGTHHRGT